MVNCKCMMEPPCGGELHFTDCITRIKKSGDLAAQFMIRSTMEISRITDNRIQMIFELDANGLIELINDAKGQLRKMENWEKGEKDND